MAASPLMQSTKIVEEGKGAPMNLLQLNKMLDQRVKGNMKFDNIRDGQKDIFYGKEGSSTLRQSAKNNIFN